MKSKDLIAEKKAEMTANLMNAIQQGDEGKLADAFASFAESVEESILQEANGLAYQQWNDTNVLVGRGARQLTSQETNYYSALANAMKSGNPKQELTNIKVAMPETIIDSVMEDMVSKHPLLNAINFRNTNGSVKMVVNKQGVQTAVWGSITEEIKKELSGAFKEIITNMNKLTAFMSVSKAFLDLGPQWLDRYVRETLSEAHALALESAIVDGDGNEKPIGMTRDVSDHVTVTGGVYPKKTAVTLNSFYTEEYCKALAPLTIGPTGKKREIDKVILVVNPTDYLTRVMPATTYLTQMGTYAMNVFPFPTEVIQSVALADGEAVVGLSGRYFMAFGSPKEGRIEYDDSYRLLEDERVYITKFYGTGMPLDNNAFQLLDISGMKPITQKVEVTNVVKTKAQA